MYDGFVRQKMLLHLRKNLKNRSTKQIKVFGDHKSTH